MIGKRADQEEAGAGAGEGIQVLFVEPDPNVRAWMIPELESRGYLLKVAENGPEALRLLERDTFHLVFVDENLEGSPGRDLVVHIVRTAPFTSCAFISDLDDSTIHEVMESLGIIGHVGRERDEQTLLMLLDHFEKVYQTTITASSN